MTKKIIIYLVFWLHLTHLAQGQQSQSDLVSIHVQLIPITDSAALVRCSRTSLPGAYNPKEKVTPIKPIDCRISFETSERDTTWIALEWIAFDHEHHFSHITRLYDIDTEKNGTNLKEFIDTLRLPLVILENPEGEFRILYGKRGQYDRRLNKHEAAVNCIGAHMQPTLYNRPWYGRLPPRNEHGDWITPLVRARDGFYRNMYYQPFNLPSNLCGYPTLLFSFDDLRVKKGDTSCRMHYVYVSSTSNPKLERIRRVYTSNWFPLNEE